jgi:excisionase family DNA binding protein
MKQTPNFAPEPYPANYQNLGFAIEQLIFKSVKAALALHGPTGQCLISENSPEKEITFSIPELANYLKCTKATIHAYKKRGIFPYYQTGRTVFFKKSEVDKALAVGTKKKGVSN